MASKALLNSSFWTRGGGDLDRHLRGVEAAVWGHKPLKMDPSYYEVAYVNQDATFYGVAKANMFFDPFAKRYLLWCRLEEMPAALTSFDSRPCPPWKNTPWTVYMQLKRFYCSDPEMIFLEGLWAIAVETPWQFGSELAYHTKVRLSRLSGFLFCSWSLWISCGRLTVGRFGLFVGGLLVHSTNQSFGETHPLQGNTCDLFYLRLRG